MEAAAAAEARSFESRIPRAAAVEQEGEKGDREGAESLGKENREGVQDVRLNRARRVAGD